VIFKGPLQENDRAQQIALVQQFLGEGIDASCLAPLDHSALVSVVGQAHARNVPVVIFDSALDGTPGRDFASFVATDNEAGGRLGGEQLAKLLAARARP
jgi:ribose transport system substrate-binding protein